MARHIMAERLAWIRSAPVKGPAKAMLLSISALADSAESCTASFSQLAQLSGLAKRTAMKSVMELEKKGLVTVTRRLRDGGGHQANRYRLRVSK